MDTLAEQAARFVQANFDDGEAIDIVAFSMGGLVARYYVQQLGGAARTKRLTRDRRRITTHWRHES